jgi:hypothetical protein
MLYQATDTHTHNWLETWQFVKLFFSYSYMFLYTCSFTPHPQHMQFVMDIDSLVIHDSNSRMDLFHLKKNECFDKHPYRDINLSLFINWNSNFISYTLLNFSSSTSISHEYINSPLMQYLSLHNTQLSRFIRHVYI